MLPVLLITENNFSAKSFEKLLQYLQKHQFQTLLPSSSLKNPLPTRPLLLVLAGGYQYYFQPLISLLEKYQACAAVSIPVKYMGEYDAWNQNGPWKNILTADQLLTLQKSGRVEILSQAMTQAPLHTLSTEELLWQLEESKNRLQHHKITVQGLLLPEHTLPTHALLQTISKHYYFCIQRKYGNNAWPLTGSSLRVFFFSTFTCLHRLGWKLLRR
ncbi:MAG: hypothetical protein IKN49_06530 [Elusimicrobiaceae bacterium]|nr:hypothetical protein [Elusimicrobiaceae bacterium]